MHAAKSQTKQKIDSSNSPHDDCITTKIDRWLLLGKRFFTSYQCLAKSLLTLYYFRFSIVNLTKEDSLYNEGMKPLMYSVKDSQLHSIGWRRFGDNITYFSNDNV